ncbi:hypothetical protein HZH68_002485 [Vespula germanica]|uniref:Uncharacterized protein n=1 Tax=Vespula germanica TaxID=30212 RepID=A0A834U0L6_VESGE|nr:hypothetical protein HZH68_002485 [Vespula germanica]
MRSGAEEVRPESGTREESPILSKVKGCQRKIERDRSFHLRSLRPTSSPRRLSKHKEERFDFLKELGVSLPRLAVLLYYRLLLAQVDSEIIELRHALDASAFRTSS